MTPEQRKNTTNLLAIIKNKIENPSDFYSSRDILDFWVQPCGTVGCVLGDYVLEYRQAEISDYKSRGISKWYSAINSICVTFDFEKEFGFSRYEDCERINVIGDSEKGTLEERYKYVSEVLESELK